MLGGGLTKGTVLGDDGHRRPPCLGVGRETVGREGVGYGANGGVQRALPLARRHLSGELGAVLLADRLRHALGLLG